MVMAMIIMKKSIDGIKQAWDYFINEPEKTEVIIQHYFINPVTYHFTKVILCKVTILRNIILRFYKPKD